VFTFEGAKVVTRVRQTGVNGTRADNGAAVHRSAASLGATLTPGDIAIERAGQAAARLDAYLNAMKRSGVLRTIFTTLRVSVHRDSKRF
jgi:hypothetical protein